MGIMGIFLMMGSCRSYIVNRRVSNTGSRSFLNTKPYLDPKEPSLGFRV